MSNEIFEEICVILKEFIIGEEAQNIVLEPSTELESLGIDSVKYINLFLNLEDVIGKELDEVAEFIDMENIQTVNDLVELVQELKNK